jgi:hypothetical protein
METLQHHQQEQEQEVEARLPACPPWLQTAIAGDRPTPPYSLSMPATVFL